MSAHSNIAVFVPHLGCKHLCSFCNQNHITGCHKQVKAEDVDEAVKIALNSKNYDPENSEIAFFGGINKCRFKGKVKPGDKLRLETKIIRHKGPMGVGEAVASVDGRVVAQAELTFMVGAAQ